MKQLISAMEQSLSAGQDLVLVTIVAATGATPRGAGARMAVDQSGRLWGTIGGGAVEHRAIGIAQELLRQRISREHSFFLNEQDVQDLGMVCGGSSQVFFQYLSAGDRTIAETLRRAEQMLAADEPFWLLSWISCDGGLELFTEQTAPRQLLALLRCGPGRYCADGREFYAEPMGNAGRVLIFGAGHVSQELEPVLSRLGFRCTVVDDRPEFADPALFPTACQVVCTAFSGLREKLSPGKNDYVCIMTRGHAHDTDVAAQMLPCGVRYLGMIGSRKKHAAVCRALQEIHGFSPAQIGSIVSPIGLSIGAKTPAEIAVSIAAQLIAARAGT